MSILKYKNIKPNYYYCINDNHFNHFVKVMNYINNSQYAHIKHRESNQYKARNKLISYLSSSLNSSSRILIGRITQTISVYLSENV